MGRILMAVGLILSAAGAFAQGSEADCVNGGQAFRKLYTEGAVEAQRVQEISYSDLVEAKGPPGRPSGDGLQEAKAELDKLVHILQSMIDKKEFKDEAQELQLYKLLASAKAALEGVNREIAQGGEEGESKMDRTIAQVRSLQKILGSYLGEKEFGGRYRLKEADFELEVEVGAAYEEISKRLPFLRGAAKGRIKIGRQQIVTQFNSLKAEFYGMLLEGAHFDKKDSRLKGLAKWGNETAVIYPGQGWMDSEPIITTKQLWELD